MGKKQTSAPHSSTVSEIISLDAGFRMDGIPDLDQWEFIKQEHGEVRDKTNQINYTSDDDSELVNVDYVSANAKSCRSGDMLLLKTTKPSSR